MKPRLTIIAAMAIALTAACEKAKEPVDYVDPYIGNVSHLLVPTFPTVHLPNSMLRVFPKRWDYTTERIDGFPIIVTSHRETSPFTLSVTQGEPAPVVSYSYDREKITPYSYEVTVADGDIDVEFAVSHHILSFDKLSLASSVSSLTSSSPPINPPVNNCSYSCCSFEISWLSFIASLCFLSSAN